MATTHVPPLSRILQRTRLLWQAGLALLFGLSGLVVRNESDPGLADPSAALLRWLPPTFVLLLLAALSYQAGRPLGDPPARERRRGYVFGVAATLPLWGLLVALLLMQQSSPDDGSARGITADLGTAVGLLRYLCFLPALAYVLVAARILQVRHGTRLDRALWWLAAVPFCLLALLSAWWNSPTFSIDALMLLSIAPAVPVLFRSVARNRIAPSYPLATPPPLPKID